MVVKRERCARTGNWNRHWRWIKFFPATVPLEFIALNILGPLPEKTKQNQCVLLVTKWYSKLARAVSISQTTFACVASLFLEHSSSPSEYPRTYRLKIDRSLLASSWFVSADTSVWKILQLQPTAHRRTAKPSGLTEQPSSNLRLHLADRHKIWDLFVQPLTFAYNTQIRKSTNTSP